MILLVITIILFAVASSYFLLNSLKNKENKILEEQNLISGIYPLYPNLSWNNKIEHSDTFYDGLKIIGFKIDSKNIISDDYYKLDVSFDKYYDDKLSSLGWTRETKYDADGAGSSSRVYKKGEKYIMLSYDSTAINQIPNEPLSCPCNMSFSIFYGEGNKKITKDAITECSLLENDLDIAQCYEKVAIENKDISICNKIKAVTYVCRFMSTRPDGSGGGSENCEISKETCYELVK